MTTNTDRTARIDFCNVAPPESRNARLLQRVEDATIFCAFALALSFMATSAVMVVYA